MTRLGWILLGLVTLVIVGCAAFAPPAILFRFEQDDGFYYWGIAKNWAQGVPSSFDGIHVTNGYHPLWQWLLIPVARVIDSPIGFVRFSLVLGVALNVLSAGLIWAKLRRVGWSSAWLAPAWFSVVVLPTANYGMESPLAIFMLGLCVFFWPVEDDEPGALRGLICGLVGGLLFLSRLDMLTMPAAMSVPALIGARTRRGRVFLVTLVLVQALFVCGYFLTNYLTWGHWLTVSALAKQGRAEVLGTVPQVGGQALVAAFVGLAGLAALQRRYGQYRRGVVGVVPGSALVAWTALGCLAYLGVLAMRGGAETFGWYYAVPAACGAVTIPGLLAFTRPDLVLRGYRRAAVIVTTVLLCSAGLGRALRNHDMSDQLLYISKVADRLASYPEHSRIIALSDCGLLSVASGQRLVNLDGLTGSYDFQYALRDDRMAQWLKESGLNTYLYPRMHWTFMRGEIWTKPVPVESGRMLQAVLNIPPGMYGVGRSVVLLLDPHPLFDIEQGTAYQVLDVLPLGGAVDRAQAAAAVRRGS